MVSATSQPIGAVWKPRMFFVSNHAKRTELKCGSIQTPLLITFYYYTTITNLRLAIGGGGLN